MKKPKTVISCKRMFHLRVQKTLHRRVLLNYVNNYDALKQHQILNVSAKIHSKFLAFAHDVGNVEKQI